MGALLAPPDGFAVGSIGAVGDDNTPFCAVSGRGTNGFGGRATPSVTNRV
jgi:hypothetical protein